MIDRIIEETRLFEILYESLNFHNNNVKEILICYIDKYIAFKGASAEELKSHYESFLKQYNRDAKRYINSNTYPALEEDYNYEITREEYDVFLLLSTVLTQHRYDIMANIYNILEPLDSALVIGSGVGIELELINNSYKNISAYDINIDGFCNETHKDINFYEEEFLGGNSNQYNDIYIIELLEHVRTPYKLIENAKKSLKDNGRIIITLAINIPQFDHVFNFDNLDLFNKEIDDLNLSIIYSEDIKHMYLINGLTDSRNIFMILKEKQ